MKPDLDDAARRRIETPCIGVCDIDLSTDWCAGCFRTLAEVAAWSTSSASQRRQILDRVERRRVQQQSA
jgi:predicted Fe-S protein YdhL (DUF1289 family)